MQVVIDDDIQICEGENLPTLGNGSTAIEGENEYLMPDGDCFILHKVFVVVNQHTRVTEQVQLHVGDIFHGIEVTATTDTIVIVDAGAGTSGCDLITTYVVELVTSTINMDDNPDIIVFPNPTQGRITIRGIEGIQQIQVYSLTGQLVQIIVNSNTIDIGSLPDALYILRILTNKDQFTGKVNKAVPRA
jgi:hypothetical protein